MVFSVIGWTIIHSLWQCLALLAALELTSGLVDMRRSGARYAVALAVLGMAVTGVLVTFIWEWRVFGSAAFSSAAVAAGGGAAGPVAIGSGAVLAGGGLSSYGSLWWLTAVCPYLTAGWVLGVLYYSARLLAGGIQLRGLRRSPGVGHAGAEAILESLRVRMGILRPLRLLITEHVAEPMAFGIWRGVVVLPLSFVCQVPPEQLEVIVAHELAHIRRRDYAINLIQHVFDGLLFFNPFYRMISAKVREEREYCCDDMAAVVAGDRRKMAVALTNLGLVKRGMALGLSAAPGRRSFYRRVSRLIEPQERPALSVRGILAGFFVALVLAVGLTQCSRSMATQAVLPSPGDQVKEVLEDNQAGFFERVFYYNKGGQDHDLFIVMTQDRHQVNSAYVDGERLDQGELGSLMQVLNVIRRASTKMVTVSFKARLKKDKLDAAVSEQLEAEKMVHPVIRPDSIKIKLLAAPGRDSSVSMKLRLDQMQVKLAMTEYAWEMKQLPFAVEQHELLTRIVRSNSYTANDRQQLNELISKRQRLAPRIVPDH